MVAAVSNAELQACITSPHRVASKYLFACCSVYWCALPVEGMDGDRAAPSGSVLPQLIKQTEERVIVCSNTDRVGHMGVTACSSPSANTLPRPA